MTQLGCDVSYCQSPSLVPWGDERVEFAIVKATEGVHTDINAAAHVAKIRAANKPLGLYHFFHPEIDRRAQFEEFDACSRAVGYGKPGDIVPAIDLEYFHGHEVLPTWSHPALELAEMFAEAFSARPLLYCSAATWVCMGRPAWVLEHPLWVPMYMIDGYAPPATLAPKYVPGGGEWAIWQYFVGPLFAEKQASKARGAVDHNRARRLPLIGSAQ